MKSDTDEDKAARLAEALRANLHKRKAQARARVTGQQGDAPAEDPAAKDGNAGPENKAGD